MLEDEADNCPNCFAAWPIFEAQDECPGCGYKAVIVSESEGYGSPARVCRRCNLLESVLARRFCGKCARRELGLRRTGMLRGGCELCLSRDLIEDFLLCDLCDPTPDLPI